MSLKQHPVTKAKSRREFALFVTSIVALLGAVFLALLPVNVQEPPRINPEAASLGYTFSLSLFTFPVLVLGGWLLSRKDLLLARKSFWWTVLPWTVIGCSLDFLLASRLFLFPGPNTVLPWIPCVPILGDGKAHTGACPSDAGTFLAGAPIEEFLFYTTGFLAVLLVYIWADEAWLQRYNPPDYEAGNAKTGRILRLDLRALAWGATFLGLGWVYKNEFPLYFAFLVAFAVVPASALFKTASRYVNWRAFSFTFFWILLISLIWGGLPGTTLRILGLSTRKYAGY